MNGRQNGIKIGIIIVTAVVIFLAVFVVSKYVKVQQAEKELYEETMSQEAALRPLEAEREKIKRELEELDSSHERYNMSLSSTIIIVTEPDERIVTDFYPIVKERGYKAVLCMNEEKFPGKEGMMSIDQARKLIDEGWEAAILTDENTDIYSSYFKIKEAGLGYSEALYVVGNGNLESKVTDYMINESRDLMIPMIIRHRESGENDDKSHTYVNAVGASEKSNKRMYEDAVSYSEAVALSFGYENDIDSFSENKVKNILNSIKEQKDSEKTEVCSIKEAIERAKERDEKIASGEMKTIDERKELEDRLKEIEAEIEALND